MTISVFEIYMQFGVETILLAIKSIVYNLVLEDE